MTLSKSYFYSRESQQEIQHHIKHVAQIIAGQAPEGEQNLINQFVQFFYTNPSLDYFKRHSVDQLTTMLMHVWQFYQHKQTPAKFEVKRVQYNDSGQNTIFINMTAPNMSFLVDSLLGLLDRYNLKHSILFHPLFEATRQDNGQLTDIKGPTLKRKKVALESLVHCEINQPVSNSVISEIEAEIEIMLREIQVANEDWVAMRTQCNQAMQQLSASDSTKHTSTLEFLRWIENGHFTFLGYAYYDLDVTSIDHPFKRSTAVPCLGILKDAQTYNLPYLFKGINIDQKTHDYIFSRTPLLINKTSQVSRVHRAVPMDSVGVRCFDESGHVIGIHVFIGLFTSVAYDSSARDIPMLREKIDQIIFEAGFDLQWHDGKALVHILDSLPRDELFQATISELKEIGLAILRLQERSKVALFVRADIFNRFLSCLVFIPRERFDSQLCTQLGNILAQELKGEIGIYKAQFGSLSLARVHYTVTVPYGFQTKYNLKKIEDHLIEASKTWADLFKITLDSNYIDSKSQQIFNTYNRAFGRGYQDRFTAQEALADINKIEEVLINKKMALRLYNTVPLSEKRLKLKLYNMGTSLTLSDALPLFENLGFRVISEIPFHIKLQEYPQDVWIHDFELEHQSIEPFDLQLSAPLIADTFIGTYDGYIENDSFNRLITLINLDWRTINIFRAYAKYIRQLQLPYSKYYIAQALENNPVILKLLWAYFQNCFDPQHQQSKKFDVTQIVDALDKIDSPDEDRILRLYYNLMTATMRTNFYQRNSDQSFRECISFKFSSRLIDELPLPKPLYEIFIYSPRVEAIHLRGGKVARGGIRWSDRMEDFRSEVLGLMKAQIVKNSIIVPVGSKGGFVIKSSTQGLTRDALQQEAIVCYQIMMRGLLDLSDNYVAMQQVRPKNTVCYDDFDPYIVVAADKGTASFSDIANQISIDHGFWLGDAFASGGSAGYDHKKMGITARGAWEGVKRHFRELGKDIQKEAFTVVGVGDMSGDVFGNGLLLSKKTLLIAAFNHQHIFIDPTPDCEKSYKERKRLFNLPRSSWSDYNADALSSGGKIYSRLAKTVTLTPQIQQLLNIHDVTLKPDDLIKVILTSQFDLLWLGGIGTFIKARTESHSDVGDRTNDAVRINGQQLQCKVIGEGANLGITQSGRIEFSRLRHGKLNTDFIDNSAGVSCSDREVNIKILCQHILSFHSLTLQHRNTLLEKMTTSVGNLVLQDNYLQPQILSMLELQGVKKLDQHIHLIRTLEQEGLIIRQLEGLPDDAGLEEYQKNSISLTRPEHAVLLSYSKISFYDKLLKLDIIQDAYFDQLLMSYFPQDLQDQYAQEIKTHPLRQEIIATMIANKILNRMGQSFILECIDIAGTSINQIVHAYFVIVEIFKLDDIWKSIENLDNKVQAQHQLLALLDIYKILKRTLLWIVRYYPLASTIEESVAILQVGVRSFIEVSNNILTHQAASTFGIEVQKYTALHFPVILSKRIALLNTTSLAPDIILISNRAQLNIAQVTDLYFYIGDHFHFNELRQALDGLNLTMSSWERLQANGLMEDLYVYQSQLVLTILTYYHDQLNISNSIKMSQVLNRWVDAKADQLCRLTQLSKDLGKSKLIDLANISVYTRELRLISSL